MNDFQYFILKLITVSFVCVIIYVLLQELTTPVKVYDAEPRPPILECITPFNKMAVYQYELIGKGEILTEDNWVFNMREHCTLWVDRI